MDPSHQPETRTGGSSLQVLRLYHRVSAAANALEGSRQREVKGVDRIWIPACAGMTQNRVAGWIPGFARAGGGVLSLR
jgi:hypothetical protein